MGCKQSTTKKGVHLSADAVSEKSSSFSLSADGSDGENKSTLVTALLSNARNCKESEKDYLESMRKLVFTAYGIFVTTSYAKHVPVRSILNVDVFLIYFAMFSFEKKISILEMDSEDIGSVIDTLSDPHLIVDEDSDIASLAGQLCNFYDILVYEKDLFPKLAGMLTKTRDNPYCLHFSSDIRSYMSMSFNFRGRDLFNILQFVVYDQRFFDMVEFYTLLNEHKFKGSNISSSSYTERTDTTGSSPPLTPVSVIETPH